MKTTGLINSLIAIYLSEGLSPERLQHDLKSEHGISISWDALMNRWERQLNH